MLCFKPKHRHNLENRYLFDQYEYIGTCRNYCLSEAASSCTLQLLRNFIVFTWIDWRYMYLKLLRLYLTCTGTARTCTCLCLIAWPPCPPAAAGGHGGQAIRQPASSRIPRRAIRGELRTVESQNSLRNRDLLYARAAAGAGRGYASWTYS